MYIDGQLKKRNISRFLWLHVNMCRIFRTKKYKMHMPLSSSYYTCIGQLMI